MFRSTPWWTTTAAHSAASVTRSAHREVTLTGSSSIVRWLNLQCTVLPVRLVRAYRVLFSPLFAGSCRFVPSCSHYAEEALQRHGCVRGLWLTACRLGRCHPFHGGGYDPVPGSAGRSQGQRIWQPAVRNPRPTAAGAAPGEQGERWNHAGSGRLVNNTARQDAAPAECSETRGTTRSSV